MSEPITRQQIEAKLVGRVWKDEGFRQEFLGDPKGTIEKYAAQKLPADLKVYVHQEDANTLHITIPQQPAQMSELTDADLEKVAGGVDVVVTAATAVSAVSLMVFSGSVSVISMNQTRREGW